jgi:DNA replication protein DnaC
MKYASNHGVGKRFQHATLAQLNKKYFAEVLSYSRDYKKHLQRGEGLLLSGPPGIGKTFAVTALQRYIKEKEGGLFDYYIVTAPKLFEMYVDYRTANDVDAHRGKSWNRIFEEVPGMVINDLGKEERLKEWQQEAAAYRLGRLLRARHEEQRPIFITTNFPVVRPRDGSGITFQEAYGESIWSLVQDMTCARVQIVAPDLRARKAERELREDSEDEE